jgi:hypothetical protein
MSKGSRPRPYSKKKFDEGWERVFGKNTDVCIFCGDTLTEETRSEEFVDVCKCCDIDIREYINDNI